MPRCARDRARREPFGLHPLSHTRSLSLTPTLQLLVLAAGSPATATSTGAPSLLTQLFIMFGSAVAVGELLARVRLPAVLGELLVGVALGPSVLNVVHPGASLEAIAQLGVVILLFEVGLQSRVSELARVGKIAVIASSLGVVASLVLAGGLLLAVGQPFVTAAFVAVAVGSTSAGVAARVLSDLGHLENISARVILGAAIADDIIGLLLLSVVSAFANHRQAALPALALVLGEALAFVAIAVFVGPRLMRQRAHLLDRPRTRRGALVAALVLCLALGSLAEAVDLGAIIGAFLAGLILAEVDEQHGLARQLEPVAEFLVPFFFVLTGAGVNVAELGRPSLLGLTLALTAVAIVGKTLGCGAGALSLGGRRALVVGAGMVPRGEVTLVVIAAGQALGVVPASLYAAVVATAVLTTLIAPPTLALLFKWETARPATPSAPASAK